jgi:uncharacterized protein
LAEMHAVRDPLWKHIYIPQKLYEACFTREFLRLSNIKQLGPTYMVYPGATHTRASHSFGVYHIANRLLDNLLHKGASQWVTKTGCASFRAAALFHDLGHFPYTHSLKELPLLDHEQLTGTIILNNLSKYITESGGNPEQTAQIVDTSILTDNEETLFFRKLLSGVLDPDKLDYLNRDAFFCGVPYGIQDTDFVLSTIIPDKQRGIVISSASILSVENLLFSKYLMYRAVYWHKTVRIATAMMKKTLYTALQNEIIQPKELYTLDDQGLYGLLENKEYFEELECADGVKQRKIYSVLYEISFSPANSFHTKLEKLDFRYMSEIQLAQIIGCKPYQILIDIPERVSFESDLWIKDENTVFSQSSTVFTSDTVSSFTAKLRKVRCAIDPGFLSHASETDIINLKKLIEDFFSMQYT